MQNVWKMNRVRFRRYLSHPLQFFGDFFRRVKWSWQRVTKGYCDFDLFAMDEWLTSILPPALREFATDTYSYPGEINGYTPTGWEEYLNDMADAFEGAREHVVDGGLDAINAEYKRMEESKDKAFGMMKESFFSLWS